MRHPLPHHLPHQTNLEHYEDHWTQPRKVKKVIKKPPVALVIATMFRTRPFTWATLRLRGSPSVAQMIGDSSLTEVSSTPQFDTLSAEQATSSWSGGFSAGAALFPLLYTWIVLVLSADESIESFPNCSSGTCPSSWSDFRPFAWWLLFLAIFRSFFISTDNMTTWIEWTETPHNQPKQTPRAVSLWNPTPSRRRATRRDVQVSPGPPHRHQHERFQDTSSQCQPAKRKRETIHGLRTIRTRSSSERSALKIIGCSNARRRERSREITCCPSNRHAVRHRTAWRRSPEQLWDCAGAPVLPRRTAGVSWGNTTTESIF